MELHGLALTLHVCSSTGFTTDTSRRLANVYKKYVCVVPAVYIFEIFRGVSLLEDYWNSSHNDITNGNFFFFSFFKKKKTKQLFNPVMTLSESVVPE